ncbi:MAG TPA: patatin-like phospholipase family protein [Anaerolineales bacterium]|nr:patatin-like phospholipase family protein [Anaerolineales bacterium]
MKSFRKNVAIAIDGGGIRGVIVTKALSMLEDHLKTPIHDIFRLAAGTSTGSIISAGIGSGLTAVQLHQLYVSLGDTIFRKSWRTFFWPLTRYRYPHEPLAKALKENMGDHKMGDFWSASPHTDVVISTFDLLSNQTRFIKPWKPEYKNWPVIRAILASSSVPTFFPVVEGRYVDGGVGSYANPCYLAAYEAKFCLNWDLKETTLISLGTGRDPQAVKEGQPNRFMAWDWLAPTLDAFMASAGDQQVNLVETFFDDLDFRRFQVDLKTSIPMDEPSQIPELLKYGEMMGKMILNDQVDRAQGVIPSRAP